MQIDEHQVEQNTQARHTASYARQSHSKQHQNRQPISIASLPSAKDLVKSKHLTNRPREIIQKYKTHLKSIDEVIFILVIHNHDLIWPFMRCLHFLYQTVLILQDLVLLFLYVAAIKHVLRHGIVRIIEMIQGYFLFGGDDLLGQRVLLPYVLRKGLALELLSMRRRAGV